MKNAIRRVQVEVKDEFGIPGSRGMTLAKKVLRIGIVSGLVHGNLAWENGDSTEALSQATVWSPITFESTFDAVFALMISLILLFACIGFICTLQFAFTKQKRYVDVSVQTWNFEEQSRDTLANLTLPDEFAEQDVYVTLGGRCYHKQSCKWLKYGATRMSLSEAIRASYKICQTCHDFGKGAGRASHQATTVRRR